MVALSSSFLCGTGEIVCLAGTTNVDIGGGGGVDLATACSGFGGMMVAETGAGAKKLLDNFDGMVGGVDPDPAPKSEGVA